MRILACYLLVVMLFTSCSYFNDPGSELILNVDTEFEIDMIEQLIPNGREIKFVVTSLGDVNCENSELILNTQRQLSAINITIKDIAMTEGCIEGTSFPEGEAVFSVRNSTYDLAFQVKDLESQMGFFDVTEKSYTIDMPDLSGLILQRDHLKRIPDNFLWGYYQTSNESAVEQLQSLFQRNGLEQKPLTTMEEGFYSYFSIDKEGQIQVSNLPYGGAVNRFAFPEVDMDQLKLIFEDFKIQNPSFKVTFLFSDGTVM